MSSRRAEGRQQYQVWRQDKRGRGCGAAVGTFYYSNVLEWRLLNSGDCRGTARTGDVCDVATAGQELMSCAALVVIVFINYGPAVSASDIYHFTEQFVPQVWTVCNCH